MYEKMSPFQEELEKELWEVLERYPKLRGIKYLEFNIDLQCNCFYIELRSNGLGGFVIEIDDSINEVFINSYEDFINDIEDRIGSDRLLCITLFDWK